MATSKRQTTEPLTTDQRREIRAQFVVEGLPARTIAHGMRLSVHTVRAEIRRADLDTEASLVDRDPRTKALRLLQPEEEAKAQAEVKRLCRAISLTRLNGQLDVARELARLAATKQAPVLSSKGEQGLAAALGPAESDIKGGRLSVDLTTDKVDTGASPADYAAAIMAVLDPQPAEADVADAAQHSGNPPVVRNDRLDPARGPAAGD